MVNDYNVALMQSLHSVFWYQGLLEQDGDEWITFPNISRPKYTDNCVIVRLIEELKNKKTKYNFYCHEDIKELCEDFSIGHQYNVIWIMLVEMFGSCGTSPRTGWIDKRKECADFLQQILEIEERTMQRGIV